VAGEFADDRDAVVHFALRLPTREPEESDFAELARWARLRSPRASSYCSGSRWAGKLGDLADAPDDRKAVAERAAALVKWFQAEIEAHAAHAW
jgi:hypothetical protein